MAEKDVFQPVDDAARRLAKTLIRTERHGALATLEPGSGVPLASRVSIATEADGAPVFLISQLSPHFAALEADARTSLMLGSVGKGDPLAHSRLTAIGRAERLPREADAPTRRRFLARHPKAALYAEFTDFAFWRLHIERVQLIGGYGRAYHLEASDLAVAAAEGLAEIEAGAVEHMNDDHLDAIQLYAAMAGAPEAAWQMASFDAEGLDMVAADATARLWFDKPLTSAEELRPRLVALAKRARAATPDATEAPSG
ncbi:MAG: DUF2470 domain-containing protein [Pseudomonadota bacterium]